MCLHCLELRTDTLLPGRRRHGNSANCYDRSGDAANSGRENGGSSRAVFGVQPPRPLLLCATKRFRGDLNQMRCTSSLDRPLGLKMGQNRS